MFTSGFVFNIIILDVIPGIILYIYFKLRPEQNRQNYFLFLPCYYIPQLLVCVVLFFLYENTCKSTWL